MNNIVRISYYTSECMVVSAPMVKANAIEWKRFLSQRIAADDDRRLGLIDWLRSLRRITIHKEEIIRFIDRNRLKLDSIRIPDDYLDLLRQKCAGKVLSNYREIVIRSPLLEDVYSDEIPPFENPGTEICWCRCYDEEYEDCRVLVIDEVLSLSEEDLERLDQNPNYPAYWDDAVMKSILGDNRSPSEKTEECKKYYSHVYYNLVSMSNMLQIRRYQDCWRFFSRAILHYAVDNGYDELKFPRGKMQAARCSWKVLNLAGLEELFDKVIISHFKVYLANWNIRTHPRGDWWSVHLAGIPEKMVAPELIMTAEPSDCIWRANDILLKSLGKMSDLKVVHRTELKQDSIKGWYDRAYSKAYIVPENHGSLQDFTLTLIKLIVPHGGLRKLLGDDYCRLLENVWEDMMRQEDRDMYQRLHRDRLSGIEAFCLESFKIDSSGNDFLREFSDCLSKIFLDVGLEIPEDSIDTMDLLKMSFGGMAF